MNKPQRIALDPIGAMTAHRTPSDPAHAHLPVLIIDDHELVGTSLALSLQVDGVRARWCRPRGMAGILNEAATSSPGLALLDLDLGRDDHGRHVDGLHVVRPLLGTGWRVLVLSGTSDRSRIGAALAAGALAWVPKNAPFPSLLRAVRTTLAGGEVMSPARRNELIGIYEERTLRRGELVAKLDRLTQREREVLAELARGVRAQAVAEHFVVALPTVRTQIRAILTKLEVSSQLEAVALFRRTSGS